MPFKKKIFLSLILVVIIALGAFLRLYHLPQWFHFASDEARDLFVLNNMFEKGDIPFRGPSLSIAGDKFGFLGPAYYYLIALPFLLSNGHPLGPVIFTAILSIATIYLLYRIGKDFIDLPTGLIAALFYAVSFLVTTFSRAAWNPNLLPFFIALGIYSFLKIVNGHERYTIWLAVSMAIVVQLHSTAFLWPLAILVSWIIVKRHSERSEESRFVLNRDSSADSRQLQNDRKRIWLHLWSGSIFLLILVPWIAAEIRSGFVNLSAYLSILGSKTETFAGETYVPPSLWTTFFNFFDEVLTNRMIPGLSMMVIAGLIIFLISQIRLIGSPDLFKSNNKSSLPVAGYWLLVIWLFISFVGYYFYKHILFIHYFIFLFPLAILLASIFLGWLWQKGLGWKLVTILTIVIIVGVNLYAFADYAQAMNGRRLDKFTHATDTLFVDIDQVVRYIEKDADQPFRLYFILPPGPPFQNSRAYDYLFEYYGAKKPVDDNTEMEIVYVIIQPKDVVWRKEISDLGIIGEIKDVGVVRIIKISNLRQ